MEDEYEDGFFDQGDGVAFDSIDDSFIDADSPLGDLSDDESITHQQQPQQQQGFVPQSLSQTNFSAYPNQYRDPATLGVHQQQVQQRMPVQQQPGMNPNMQMHPNQTNVMAQHAAQHFQQHPSYQLQQQHQPLYAPAQQQAWNHAQPQQQTLPPGTHPMPHQSTTTLHTPAFQYGTPVIGHGHGYPSLIPCTATQLPYPPSSQFFGFDPSIQQRLSPPSSAAHSTPPPPGLSSPEQSSDVVTEKAKKKTVNTEASYRWRVREKEKDFQKSKDHQLLKMENRRLKLRSQQSDRRTHNLHAFALGVSSKDPGMRATLDEITQKQQSEDSLELAALERELAIAWSEWEQSEQQKQAKGLRKAQQQQRVGGMPGVGGAMSDHPTSTESSAAPSRKRRRTLQSTASAMGVSHHGGGAVVAGGTALAVFCVMLLIIPNTQLNTTHQGSMQHNTPHVLVDDLAVNTSSSDGKVSLHVTGRRILQLPEGDRIAEESGSVGGDGGGDTVGSPKQARKVSGASWRNELPVDLWRNVEEARRKAKDAHNLVHIDPQYLGDTIKASEMHSANSATPTYMPGMPGGAMCIPLAHASRFLRDDILQLIAEKGLYPPLTAVAQPAEGNADTALPPQRASRGPVWPSTNAPQYDDESGVTVAVPTGSSYPLLLNALSERGESVPQHPHEHTSDPAAHTLRLLTLALSQTAPSEIHDTCGSLVRVPVSALTSVALMLTP